MLYYYTNRIIYYWGSISVRWLLDQLMTRVKNIGKKPICNLKECRAPRIGSFVFPLCWRCTSIIFTMLLTAAYGSALDFSQTNLELIWKILAAILLILPTAIDGVLQYFFDIESNNTRRIWSGLLAGVGLVNFMYIVIR